jgi:hypothetical protein
MSIIIQLRQSRSLFPIGRPQRWTWRAVNSGNHRVLAKSSETYTNRADAESVATALFSEGERVTLVRPDGTSVVLREMVE